LGGTEVTALETDSVGARLQFADGSALCAPLIVAADGGRSVLRDMAGIGVHGHDYKQMGVVTTIAHELDHHQTAYEHFRPSGPFASLPLKGRRSSLVWTMGPARWRTYEGMSAAALAPIIAKDMGFVLGAVEVIDKVQAFPLRLQLAKSFIGERVALIGDAAHIVHPIAGQGLNLGLKDVAVLSETVIEAVRLGQDIGAADVLGRYQVGRRFDTALMAMLTDGLNHLFSNDIAPVRAARDFGLGVVDRLPLVKSQLMRQAAGRDGPKLLRGLAL
jgi:2-octaprenyl-6-methoxyphenol hydroxylase